MIQHLPSQTDEIISSLVQSLWHEMQLFFTLFNISELAGLVDLLIERKGSLIFTGVGKSGFIARKIAATMSSSGTLSFFLSPQDALHGDLGIVGEGDTVFLISKSGESDELIELCPALRKKGAYLIAVVSTERDSRLTRLCDNLFRIPEVKELCPFDLAPTTSTVTQLVFGDLLAMALMRKKEISHIDFITNHPAGRIGKRYTIQVQDLMLKETAVPTCLEEAVLTDVLVELSNKKCGCVCVVNEKNILVGIFTDGDLRRAIQSFRDRAFSCVMRDLMTPIPKKITPEVLAYKAMLIMEENSLSPITVLPVVNGSSELIGLIRMHDIIRSGL